MKVICTAGHVDHGKSSLVTALTGQQPDRLAEEKRRGLTIDLGFAWTSIDGIGDVAFVDLPGHEKFVPNMLAGAGPVGRCLFVVAADEGWMPQSSEHLLILSLLGVTDGVIALTRTDLVDDETIEIAREEVREEVASSPLAHAAVVEVSSVTGAGLDTLRAALVDMLSAVAPPADLGRPRLWIDRAFTVKGAGTVVTGTLDGGQLSVGDDLVLQPDGRKGRVRGLQALGRDVDTAQPGWRVAVNLAGVDIDQVERGDALVGGDWVTTDVVEAWCTPALGTTIGRRGAWSAHVGTASRQVAVHPVLGMDLTAEGPVRLELDSPLPLAVGDRLILRESGRGITAAGCAVIDPVPPPRVRGPDRRRVHAEALAAARPAAEPGQRLVGLLALREALPAAHARAMANAPADLQVPGVEPVGHHLLSEDAWSTWGGLAVTAVASIHQHHPARAVVDLAVPRQMLAQAECPTELVDDILATLIRLDRLERVPGGVIVPGHQPRLTVEQQQARERLLNSLDSAGLTPPPLADAAAAAQADDDLVEALRVDGQIRVLPGLPNTISETVWLAAVKVLIKLQGEVGPFTASQARDALGTTRKFALPLLEAMDEASVTVRDGDTRLVRGGPATD